MVTTTNVINGVTTIVTNHVGLVDMMVALGDGSWHQPPYNQPATPYNYSDMTGFNQRVVNPGLKPLKGYWMAINDSGSAAQLWNRVLWNAALTNGCSIEVYVRAADDRPGLGSEVFVPVTNNVSFPQIRGRYIEVRLAMTRDDPSKQPVLYDLTLYGMSSGFAGDLFLDDARAYETQDGVFSTDVVGAEPLGYQWFIQYPWTNQMVLVPGATNADFVMTNVDSWVDFTMASVLVINGNGESLWLGPAFLDVVPLDVFIPASGSSGPASRYPATINVFGQPTNLNTVTVTLRDLYHTRSADLAVLLVSPLHKAVMLMSQVGGPTNGVSDAIIEFQQNQNWTNAPTTSAIPPGLSAYLPSNYGQVTQMPQLGTDPPPAGPYPNTLGSLNSDDPNGTWKVYIYDTQAPGGAGQLLGSWQLDFTFQ
jgi:hypothetical protein